MESRSRIYIHARGASMILPGNEPGRHCATSCRWRAIRGERKAGCLPATDFRLLIGRSSVRPFVSGIQSWTGNCAFRVHSFHYDLPLALERNARALGI